MQGLHQFLFSQPLVLGGGILCLILGVLFFPKLRYFAMLFVRIGGIFVIIYLLFLAWNGGERSFENYMQKKNQKELKAP